MTLAESLPLIDGILVVDADDHVVFWSRAAEALFCYGHEDALRLRIPALFVEWPPKSPLITAKRKDDTTFLSEVTVEPLAGGMRLITVRDLWGDESLSTLDEIEEVGALERDLVNGENRWSVEVFRMYGFPPAQFPPAVNEVLQRVVESDRPRFVGTFEKAIRTQQPQHLEYRVRRDSELRTLQMALKPVVDAAGKPIRLYGSVRDVTDAVNAERDREDLARQLEETKRIASLGRVAATMAHEFNNVMMGISTFVEVLRRRKEPEALERALRGMESSIKRGRTITDEILRYTRASRPMLASIDVASWLADFTLEAQAITGGTVNIHAERGLCIRGDVSQLNQVLVNLLINARDASPRDAPITIEAQHVSDQWAEIVVSDRGGGIRPEHLERIFDPLFTTKQRGTGLGLAVVQQVIQAHGGTIDVQSRLGAGTSFHLHLPIADGAHTRPSLSGASLLLVEADTGMAAGLTSLLTTEGMNVRVATEGAEAIRLIDRERPDVIVLDLLLPDVAGPTVYDHVASRWPGLPVIFISGSFDPQEIAHHLRQPHAAFLHKPFELDQLLNAITRVLGAGKR